MDTWSDRGNEEDNFPQKKSIEEPLLLASPVTKKTQIKRNLIQIIESILASYELQEKYSTKLTPLCITVINEVIKKNPEFFRVAESTLIRNINDNKIKADDVPYIINIISHLYNLLHSYDEEKKNNEPITETCSNILKFIFSVSLRESLVKMDTETDIILLILCFDNIIDSCIKLLKPKKPLEITIEPIRVFSPAPSPLYTPPEPPVPVPPAPAPSPPVFPPSPLPVDPRSNINRKGNETSCCCF
jgi:hypothetical protein